MQDEDLPPDWELEQRVFHACGDQTPEPLRELLRDLWKAYCDMEVRAVNAEQRGQVKGQNVGQPHPTSQPTTVEAA